MAELIVIVVVVLIGALAYWRFGDPDRSERLSLLIGPERPLLWIILSAIESFRSLYEERVVWRVAWTGFWLLITAINLRIYLKERAQIRGLQKITPTD